MLFDNFEFYVMKKMSINLDIFFYEKTIEIIFLFT